MFGSGSALAWSAPSWWRLAQAPVGPRGGGHPHPCWGYATLAGTPFVWLAAPAIACLGLGFYTLQVNATQMAPEAPGWRSPCSPFFCLRGNRWALPWGRRWSTALAPVRCSRRRHRPDIDRLLVSLTADQA